MNKQDIEEAFKSVTDFDACVGVRSTGLLRRDVINKEKLRKLLQSLPTYNPDTHCVVPKEPTEGMMQAYQSAFVSQDRFDMRKVWDAIIKASEQEQEK